MKKTRILSLLLCLSIFCTLIVPGTRAYAESDPDNGMKISKTATANSDGSYTITLEAFATGSKTTTVQEKDIPTDIILVLDQSGSMADDIGQVQYTAYTGSNTQNKNNYERRHNGGSANLWHKLPNGSFVSVSVTLQQTITYNKITNGRNDSSYRGYTNYWENRNNLYTYVNGEIKKVVYTRERDWPWENWRCKYALEDGTILNQNNKGSRHSPTFQNTDDGYLYLAVANENQNVYTYTYTDSNGTTQTIGTSTGANTSFTPAFYQRSTTTSGGGSRLDALKNAVNNFANAVHTKSLGKDGQVGGGDDIDHRIALVGFSSPDYNNTELLTGSAINQGDWKGTNISTGGWDGYYYFPTGYEMNGPQYGSISDAQYKAALLPMNTDAGLSGVATGVNALTAWGGTRTDNGLAMANKIFEQNPIPNGEKRNRVVIVFTDGSPTNSNGFQRAVANSAISTANAIKAGGTTVYSIGIFSGADASTAGKEPDEDYYDDGIWGRNYTDAEMSAACNWFMQKVSSNNGTPRTPSYYLSAGDLASLNNIFQQISNQIETGGAETTLSSETVVKDIISPYFTLPAGTTASGIRIDTYACTGKDGNTYTWSGTSGGPGGASATVNGDQVSVTGFNFSENWCGTETDAQGNTTVRGKKLVISFTVDPKSGFLGGNGVDTNTSAGIYENGSAQTPVMTFEQPKVNVPIPDVTVTAQDKNVYLLNDVTAEQLQEGAEVTVGGVPLDLSKASDTTKPWGLDPWQTEYVDITITVKDKDGNVIPTDGLKNLTEDTTYTIEVTVAPKTTGSTTAKTGTSTPAAKINLFKPELTFEDSEVYYGADAPTKAEYDANNANNLTNTVWKHGETLSTAESVTMIGTAPELTLTYTPDSAKIEGGKVNTKQDIAVDVAVKINGTGTDVTGHTTFVHTKCADDNTCTDPANGKFWLHVKTCQLTITKEGGADDEPYVFTVKKDGLEYTEVTIVPEGNNNSVTIYELPVGKYTIAEDTGWSWRYSANNGGSAALTAQNPTGTITCVNTKNNNQWLNGFSEVVRNIFGISH